MIYLEGHPVPQIVSGHPAGCQCRPCRARRADLAREAGMPCHRACDERLRYLPLGVWQRSCPKHCAIRAMIAEGAR